VYLPRLELNKQPATELIPVLQAIGIRHAFTGGAEFPGITQSPLPLRITAIKHKAMLEIDEQGTRAASVTSVTTGLTASAPRTLFEMKLDRPFFLTIGDAQNQKILFMAVIREP
jgi:serpin B